MILKKCYGLQTYYIQTYSSQKRQQTQTENWLFWIYNLVLTKAGGWYQKPTDTGAILNFRSCAPLQYEKSAIDRTVHLVFRSTSTREEYDKTIKSNREQWLDNQYPESWSSQVASHALEKIIREGKNKKNMAEKKKPCDYSNDSPSILMYNSSN